MKKQIREFAEVLWRSVLLTSAFRLEYRFGSAAVPDAYGIAYGVVDGTAEVYHTGSGSVFAWVSSAAELAQAMTPLDVDTVRAGP